MTILPTYNDNGPVLVHVLGSSWIGYKVTEDKEEQETLEMGYQMYEVFETFEIVKVDGECKFSRITLIMHDDILGMYHEKRIDLIPGIFD
jgi:hypothetical protein